MLLPGGCTGKLADRLKPGFPCHGFLKVREHVLANDENFFLTFLIFLCFFYFHRKFGKIRKVGLFSSQETVTSSGKVRL